MAQDARLGARLGRYKSIIVLGAGTALLAAAMIAFWLTHPDVSISPGGITQIAQIDDLRVTFQLDQPALGARVADILLDDVSASAVSGVRLRFRMPTMDMGTRETDAQLVRADHFRAQGQFFTMAGEWEIEALRPAKQTAH